MANLKKEYSFAGRLLNILFTGRLLDILSVKIRHLPVVGRCCGFEWEDVSRFWRYLRAPINNQAVLIVEVNNFHGEVVPGYVYYFLKLGYSIDVILQTEVYKSQPLVGVTDKRLRLFCSSFGLFPLMLRRSKTKRYKHVLFTTSMWYWHYNEKTNPSPSVLKYFKIAKHQSLLLGEHDTRRITGYQDKFNIHERQILCLWDFSRGLMVNSHYFGQCSKRVKNQVTQFVVVGGSSPKRKDFALLIKHFSLLCDTGLIFNLHVVGSSSLQDIPELLKPHVTLHGVLAFPKMYKVLECSDFLLPLLSPDNPFHERYITTGVTGSVQLVFGFLLPCIIQRKFADFYGFNEQNSFVYDNDFQYKLKQAICISQENYSVLCDNLQSYKNKIADKSLQNLRTALDSLKV